MEAEAWYRHTDSAGTSQCSPRFSAAALRTFVVAIILALLPLMSGAITFDLLGGAGSDTDTVREMRDSYAWAKVSDHPDKYDPSDRRRRLGVKGRGTVSGTAAAARAPVRPSGATPPPRLPPGAAFTPAPYLSVWWLHKDQPARWLIGVSSHTSEQEYSS